VVKFDIPFALKRGDHLLVKTEEMFGTFAVGGEGCASVKLVNRPVEVAVSFRKFSDWLTK